MKNKDDDKIFLPHLHEPFRREIAVNYARQEMRKIFPQLRDAAPWQSIDSQIGDWYEELSMRNFWNAIHGISIGFRLKSLVPWITSLNVQWAKKDLAVEELWFGGKFGPISNLEVSEEATLVKELLFKPENAKILKETKKNLEKKAGETAPRDDFPIFVVRKEGKLRVIDGNRRLLSAIVAGKSTIEAFIGEPTAESALYEHWVPTSLFVDLVFWHKKQIQSGRDTTETMAKVIVELIRDSSAGRIEFAERAIHRDDEIHMRLFKAVEKFSSIDKLNET